MDARDGDLDGMSREQLAQPSASALWRRLDTPGHDACRLLPTPRGWRLEGVAVFRDADAAAAAATACLRYRLDCDAEWGALSGAVRGWLGARPVDHAVVRTADGDWTLDGVACPELHGLPDLDFGFTPATDLPQLRRLALTEACAADVPVAWLDVAAGTLGLLRQRYERRAPGAWWYESPSAGYAALLEVGDDGFVRRYPRLWAVEDGG
jgi:uncharacterized protein